MARGNLSWGLGGLLAMLWLLGCGVSTSTIGQLPTDVNPAKAPKVSLPDADKDFISDADEGQVSNIDTDVDGTPDYLDLDSDNDGLEDAFEAGDLDVNTLPFDSDYDGLPNVRDLDSDGNGLDDAKETRADFDEDKVFDPFDLDDDNDSILDVIELQPTPLSPPDFDGDGIPDFRDLDSDNDTIGDRDENLKDLDGDLTRCSNDLDSDGDGIPDALEAGDANLSTPPVDTDQDRRPDFIDLDSDDDGISDANEDRNGNGVVDAGETSRVLADTDSDGASDLIELAAGSNPRDANDNPQARGGFVFVMPYEESPTPNTDTLDFSTKITNADIVFAMDTTGSMGGAIANLKLSLSSVIVPNLRSSLPGLALGVGEFRDFFNVSGGTMSNPDYPWRLNHRMMTVSTPEGVASIQGAINSLSAWGGMDFPESAWEALYQIATGRGTNIGAVPVPPFSSATAPPVTLPAGEATGTRGGVGFREGALPIAVIITDAPSHNSSLKPDYNYSFPAATFQQATDEFKALGGKLVGVAAVVDPAVVVEPRQELVNGAKNLGSAVSPTAWNLPGNTRPSNCAAGMCCTGVGGAGLAPENGVCPLVFDAKIDGTGLSGTIVKGIETLTSFTPMDISVKGKDDPGDAVDAVSAFIGVLKANSSAGAPCVSGLTAVDKNADGVAETFQGVLPGTRVCFDVIPKINSTVRPKEVPQMFRATLVVEGDGTTELDQRDVYFLVPSKIEQPEPTLN